MPVITFETSPISKEKKREVAEGFTKVDWQPFSGHFFQRLSPAFLNSTGLM